MKGARTERLAEEIRQILSQILISRAEDPRIRMALLTRIELSPDLSHARIFVSALGDEQAQEEALRAISRARSFLRGELAHRTQLRRVPELSFVPDAGLSHSMRMQQVLRELGMGQGADHDPSSDQES